MSGIRVVSLRLALAGSAGAVALLGGHAALAADAAASGAAPSTTVEEVMVTAEKRSVNIQQVPASISAIKGDKMTELGLTQLSDYTQYVPGLVVGNGGTPGQTSVTLRGIAPVSAGAVVGTYLDDTPVGSSNGWQRATIFALDLMPYDVERLEVLRGPQGTLYGAGAMGGLLKYVMVQADPSHFSGQVGGEINYTDHSTGLGTAERAAINVPIIQDKLAIRASVYDREYQGYVDNVRLGEADTNDGYQRGGRVAVTFKPTDNFRVNLNAMWNKTDFDNGSFVRLGNITSKVEDGVTIYSGDPVYGKLAGSYAYDGPFKKSIEYYSGTFNYDAGPVTAIYATSYSHTKTHQFQDATDVYGNFLPAFGLPVGVSYFDLQLDLEKWTHEFRLQSPTGGKFEWMAGAFYTWEKAANHQLVNVYDDNYNVIPGPLTNPFFAYAEVPTVYKEYAVFGDLTWNISTKFDVTGGVRYAHNEQTFRQISDGAILGGFTNTPGASSEGVTTWSVNGRYHITDQIMAYGRIATGYRPGGPNSHLPGVPPSVSSDRLTSYEGGIKSTFWGGRALFNITAFDIDWTNIQLAVSSTSCGCSFAANGGDAYSRGLEFEGSVTPVDGLRLSVNGAYTKTALTSLAVGAPPYMLNYQLPGVPKFAGGATIDYMWPNPVFRDFRPTVGAGVRYVGSEYPTPPSIQGLATSAPNTKDPSYTTADLRAGFSNDRYSVNLYVRNLFDKLAYTTQSPLQNPLTGQIVGIEAVPLEPRIIGLSIDAKF